MIEHSIRQYALQDSELTKLIDHNVFLSVQHPVTDNYVIVTVINDVTPVELHFEDNQSEARIQFDCYSQDPHRAIAIATAINRVFNKVSFQDHAIYVQLAVKQHRQPDYGPESSLYRESLDYTFNYHFLK